MKLQMLKYEDGVVATAKDRNLKRNEPGLSESFFGVQKGRNGFTAVPSIEPIRYLEIR